MALPTYTSWNYRVWHYTYLTICGLVFFFLIAPLFVILPLSFNAEQYIHFSSGMLALDPDQVLTFHLKSECIVLH